MGRITDWLTRAAAQTWDAAVLAAACAYADSLITTAIKIKGGQDCSLNPNYWNQANKVGWAYLVTAAGKIGGAAGKDVEIGDLIVCSANNAGGTEAAVGGSWFVLEKNDVVDAAAGTGSLRTLGTGALQAAAGNAQPNAHAASHRNAASDSMAEAAGTPASAAGATAIDAVNAWPNKLFLCALTESTTMGAPAHAWVGQKLYFRISQPAAGGVYTYTVAWNAVYKWSGGPIVVATGAAGAITFVEGIVMAVTGTNATEVLLGGAKAFA